MLRRAARRIEPAKSKRRRWPFLTAGLVTAICTAAAAFLNRRGAKTSQTAPATGTGTEEQPEAAPGVDADGHVRAS